MLAALSIWYAYKTPELDDTISTVAVIVSFTPFVCFVVAALEIKVGFS